MSINSWFIKYQPKTINELIFDSEEHKNNIKRFIDNNYIDGNILLYGPGGLGKTATATILIYSLIGASNDILYTQDTSVKYIDEEVKPWLRSLPIKSKKKIVYMEEIDRLSSAAQNTLKKDTLEKYQETVSFICCTNYIKKIDDALLQRFTYKIPFTGSNIKGIITRLDEILKLENAQYNYSELEEFIKINYKLGIRELINRLQILYNSNNKIIDFSKSTSVNNIETQILKLIENILIKMSKLELKTKKLCIEAPETSVIAEEYKTFVTLLHNNYDINYDLIYTSLLEKTKFIPIKLIIGKYSDSHEYKKFHNLNLIACLYEIMKCIGEITR